jgi:hypothetical protein
VDDTTALQFAQIIHPGSRDVRFGLIEREKLVAKLRQLADRIEANEAPRIALQKAYSAHLADRDDYCFTLLLLEFAELAPTAAPGTKLYASGQFPVEVKT